MGILPCISRRRAGALLQDPGPLGDLPGAGLPVPGLDRHLAQDHLELIEEDDMTWDELEVIVWLDEPDEVEEDWIEEEKPWLE